MEVKGYEGEYEGKIDEYGLVSADIVVKSKKLIIEIDGEHHCLFGEEDN